MRMYLGFIGYAVGGAAKGLYCPVQVLLPGARPLHAGVAPMRHKTINRG